MTDKTTAPIGPETVTVLGSHWKESAPWDGLHFERAELRVGSIWGDDDYHLRVPWLHPSNVAGSTEPDAWCFYRVRLKRGWRSFIMVNGEWRVSKERPA